MMAEMQQRGGAGGAPAARPRVSGAQQERKGKGVFMQFIDDLINLRATAILIVGVLAFGAMVWFHTGSSGRGQQPKGPSVGRLKSEVDEMEKAMGAILESHTGVSQAAEEAKQAVAAQHELQEKYKVSAIFVFSAPNQGLRSAMRNMALHSWVKEVILIHEIDVGDGGGKADAAFPKHLNGKKVRYFPSNPIEPPSHEFAKFKACAELAAPENNVCYYQSTHRDASGYTRSLWANFLRAPKQIHSSVGANTYFNDLELTYRDDSFGLDSGFAFLAGGAYFLKEHAVNFVARKRDQLQVVMGGGTHINQEAFDQGSDVLFSLWVNRPPAELSNNMVPFATGIGEAKLYERGAYERRARQKEIHVVALKALLTDRLRVMNGGDAKVSRTTAPITPRLDTVSSCAKDRCLLTTNIQVVPRARSMKGERIGKMLRDKLETRQATPECEVFKAHQYYYAVDGNMQTQWVTTNKNVTRNDYFGLDLLKLHKDLQTISVAAAHPFQKDLVLEVSMDNKRWFPISVKPTKEFVDVWRGFEVHRYTYDMSESLAGAWQLILETPKAKHSSTPTPPLYIQYVRFRAQVSYKLPVILFDLDYKVGDPYDGTHSTAKKA
uniref:Uncharacterized protein n=1 Tax=Hemiselmis andersenii TaxID=464988 RepID=A0A6U4PAP5_HEMAN|mmetsp:Transcript_4221/g.10013  ORF Transcript_4221/g.10013 Transcript_4221/m.10013 type:complete len:607 (+) Transcript_4221:133-1953(+)